jgi:hypothetical protein
LELIDVDVGDGLGIGVGLGDGVGVGVGVGLGDCARAGEDATAAASTRPKTRATALASLRQLASQRPVPLSLDRVGRGEPHMDAIPKKSANSIKINKIAPAAADLP